MIVVFLSGFAALLYQVIWQRLLVFFSGADVFSVTVIVAAFMGGLGAGSLIGGHLADRLGRRGSLLAFAGAELVIGLFGVISKPLYYDVLYVRFSHLASSPVLAAAMLFGTLLVPTLVMGLSVPLLARALTSSLQQSPSVIGRLYGWNTIGAAVGAFTTPWVLIPRLGLDRPLWIAAAVNLLCAMLALRLSRRLITLPAVDPGAPPSIATTAASALTDALTFRTWMLVYGLTGFIALGLEIAWFRVLGVLLKSTSFTFGTLLGIYLCGLGAGAAMGARAAARSAHAGATFLALQYALTLCTALSTAGLVVAISTGHPSALVRFLGSYDPVDVYSTVQSLLVVSWSNRDALNTLVGFAALYFVVPAVLIGPPTFLMGVSFPYLQRACQSDYPHLGRRLGSLLAANIAGGVMGAIAVGWLLLPGVGTAGTLKTLVVMGLLLGWLGARVAWPRSRARRRWAQIAVASMTAGVVLMMPNGTSLWARLHATRPDRVLFDEDGAGLSLLKRSASTTRSAEVFVNGLGQSWVPYGHIHTVLGALPAFVHPAPADVAVIGLGSGDTAFAVASRADVQRLVSIEILGAQRRTLRRFAEVSGYPGLLAVLWDPRIEHRVGDGRAYLVHAGRMFDIIEADALRPSSAYAGNLYSQEYFRLLLRRLKPGGLAVTWAPTERIRSTFLAVFPHVVAVQEQIYIGSTAAIPYDPAVIVARARETSDYFYAAGVDIIGLLQPYLASTPLVFGTDARRDTRGLNTDMFPRDEFALPF